MRIQARPAFEALYKPRSHPGSETSFDWSLGRGLLSNARNPSDAKIKLQAWCSWLWHGCGCCGFLLRTRQTFRAARKAGCCRKCCTAALTWPSTCARFAISPCSACVALALAAPGFARWNSVHRCSRSASLWGTDSWPPWLNCSAKPLPELPAPSGVS